MIRCWHEIGPVWIRGEILRHPHFCPVNPVVSTNQADPLCCWEGPIHFPQGFDELTDLRHRRPESRLIGVEPDRFEGIRWDLFKREQVAIKKTLMALNSPTRPRCQSPAA